MAGNNELPKPKDRKLFFSEQVNQESISKLTKSIIDINEHDEFIKKIWSVIYEIEYKPKPIEIYIDSYGGMVYQVFGLIGIMETSKTPIHTLVTGAAMSCGFIILIFGHKRFAYRHSTPLYHQVSSGIWGNVKDMEERYKETKRIQKKMEKMTLERTNIPKKKLQKVLKRKIDWYMTPEEALKLGVVDEIIE